MPNPTTLTFLHANGYPPACYQPLLTHLQQAGYSVHAPAQRPLWQGEDPQTLQDWHPLSRDLLEKHLPAAGEHIVIGHSVGAIAALRAALWQPQRFRALVLLDPVLFPPGFILFWNFMRLLGLGYRVHPLIPGALQRRRHFDDLERIFRAYRRKKVFQYFEDASLRAYIQGIACPNPPPQTGYTLCYSPEWEARIYFTGVWRDLELWWNLPRLRVPTLLLRGAETDTFLAPTAALVHWRNPRLRIQTLPQTTHLLPLEQPAQVAQAIARFVGDLIQ